MVLVPISLQCVLVSHPKERSGVTAIALLRQCRIVVRIHYSNMFFNIRKPDGVIDDQSMACLDDQPWTFLLYLQLLIQTTIYSNNVVHTMEF